MAMWKEEKKKRNARGSVLRGQGYEILGIGFVLLLLGFGILNLASPDREFSETENRRDLADGSVCLPGRLDPPAHGCGPDAWKKGIRRGISGRGRLPV